MTVDYSVKSAWPPIVTSLEDGSLNTQCGGMPTTASRSSAEPPSQQSSQAPRAGTAPRDSAYIVPRLPPPRNPERLSRNNVSKEVYTLSRRGSRREYKPFALQWPFLSALLSSLLILAGLLALSLHQLPIQHTDSLGQITKRQSGDMPPSGMDDVPDSQEASDDVNIPTSFISMATGTVYNGHVTTVNSYSTKSKVSASSSVPTLSIGPILIGAASHSLVQPWGFISPGRKSIHIRDNSQPRYVDESVPTVPVSSEHKRARRFGSTGALTNSTPAVSVPGSTMGAAPSTVFLSLGLESYRNRKMRGRSVNTSSTTSSESESSNAFLPIGRETYKIQPKNARKDILSGTNTSNITHPDYQSGGGEGGLPKNAFQKIGLHSIQERAGGSSASFVSEVSSKQSLSVDSDASSQDVKSGAYQSDLSRTGDDSSAENETLSTPSRSSTATTVADVPGTRFAIAILTVPHQVPVATGNPMLSGSINAGASISETPGELLPSALARPLLKGRPFANLSISATHSGKLPRPTAATSPSSALPSATAPAASEEITKVYNLTLGPYFVCFFLPILLCTLLQIPVRILDQNARLYQPFHEMTYKGGALGRDSLLLQTSGLWCRLASIHRLFSRNQSLVFLTSILQVTTMLVVSFSPTAVGMQLVGSGCDRGNPYSVQNNCAMMPAVFLRPTIIMLGLLTLMIVLVGAVMLRLRRWDTGIWEDPWSVAGTARLSLNENLRPLIHTSQPWQNHKRALRPAKFSLQSFARNKWRGLAYGVVPQDDDSSVKVVNPSSESNVPMTTTVRTVSTAQITKERVGSDLHPPEKLELPFCLGYVGRSLFLVFLSGLMVLILYYRNVSTPSSFEDFMDDESYGVTWLWTGFGTIVTEFWSTFFEGDLSFLPHDFSQGPANWNIQTSRSYPPTTV